MRFRRVIRAILLLLIVVVLVVGAAGAYVVRRPFPQISGDLRVAGLRAPVEVIRDRWGIPHINAQDTHDLFFAQGYVHAQDRLWQMELFRRVAAGRLSEVFGPVALDFDRLMRVIGLRRAAEASWAALPPEEAATPEGAAAVEAARAYSDGVNAFIESHRHRLPIEFTLLRVQPEPWSPVDGLSFGKYMAWVLGGNWRAELLRAGLTQRFGPDGARMLVPGQPAGTPTITAAGPPRITLPLSALPLSELPLVALPQGFPFAPLLAGTPGAGSNNWVVASSRSTSGGALLANDPHLDAQMPSIWYEIHLVGGPYDVIGAGFPGIPGVIIGHNQHIAWGVTNAEEDSQDLYIERFHPRDPDLYLYQGRWERARVVREEIRIKGQEETETVVVRVTRHGPVLNPAVRGLGAFLALRWVAHDPDRILEAVLALDRATTWEEFRTALHAWPAPSQNFVYADRAGNIGYLMPGRIPIRPAGADGLVPVPGWTGTFEWQGFLHPDALPTAFNPPRGYIVTANNRVVPEGYPHYLGDDYDPGFRALRITSLLEEKPRLDLEDLARIQQDVTSLLAQRFVAAWQDVRIGDPALATLFEEVKRWDGQVTADSRPALLYEGLLLELVRGVFGDALDADLFTRYLRRYDAPLLVLLDLSTRPKDPWWREGRDRMIEEALRQTVRDLERRLNKDQTQWQWGRVHTPIFQHPIGRVPALGWIFNATVPSTGGDRFTVNMGGFAPEDPFRQTVVASYRQLIDTKDWTARAIQTTGQSGLPFHRHYQDFVGMWARGEYHPMLFAREAILAAQEGTLRLVPP